MHTQYIYIRHEEVQIYHQKQESWKLLYFHALLPSWHASRPFPVAFHNFVDNQLLCQYWSAILTHDEATQTYAFVENACAQMHACQCIIDISQMYNK